MYFYGPRDERNLWSTTSKNIALGKCGKIPYSGFYPPIPLVFELDLEFEMYCVLLVTNLLLIM